jgi:hypothetical protein
MQWLTEVRDALGHFFAIFKIDLPEILSKAWGLFSEQLWPVLIDVVAQPLFWLAVAALVFGSRILSLPRYGTRASPTLHVSLAPRPLPGTATSERSVAWDHRRKAFAWLRLGYRRHSSATLMTNTCRRSSADAQLGRAAPAQCRKRWCRTDAVLRQEQLQSLEDDSSQRLTAPFAWPAVYGGSSGRSYSRKPTA